eukprot:Opistho-2@37433
MDEERDLEDVVERFCAAIESVDVEKRDLMKRETADLLMVLGMAGYANDVALDIATQLIECEVTALSIRELTFASEFMLEKEVTHFEKPEHVLKMSIRDAKQAGKSVEDAIIERLTVLRSKRTSVSPNTARRIIQGFEQARAKTAIKESIGRRKKAFQQRMSLFNKTAEAVESVEQKSGQSSRPKLDNMFLREDQDN